MASRRRCGTRIDAGRPGTAAPTDAKQNGREMGSIGRTDAGATEETSAMGSGVGEALRGLPPPMRHPARGRAARDGRPYGHDRGALRPRHGGRRPPLDTRGRQNQSKVLIHRSGRVHAAVEHGSSTAVVRPVPSGALSLRGLVAEGIQRSNPALARPNPQPAVSDPRDCRGPSGLAVAAVVAGRPSLLSFL